MPIYQKMEENWKTYCLMSAITFIEEMTKPHENIQIKKYKNKRYECTCFASTQLRMKDEEFVQKIFDITRHWEQEKSKNFLGKSFSEVKRNIQADRYQILFSPTWLSYMLSTCGKIPNKYSLDKALKRIKAIKQKHNEKKEIDLNKNLFENLLKDKELAAGAFIVSMDLECRGVQTGEVCLCMSEPFKDFLEFMLKVANKWGWTTKSSLSPVDVSYSKNLGIDVSPQFELRLNMNGLKEIYELAGPLSISHKNECIKFHVERSKKYKNLGSNLIKNNTKQKIYEALKNNKDMTTTQLQFIGGVRVDVILDHLHKLENEEKIKKLRIGKGYIWNIK